MNICVVLAVILLELFQLLKQVNSTSTEYKKGVETMLVYSIIESVVRSSMIVPWKVIRKEEPQQFGKILIGKFPWNGRLCYIERQYLFIAARGVLIVSENAAIKIYRACLVDAASILVSILLLVFVTTKLWLFVRCINCTWIATAVRMLI